jgi:hypothetical protein
MSDPEARQKAIEEVHKKLMAEGMPDPSEFTSLTPKKHGEWVKKINEALVSYCQGGKMQEMFAEIENIRKNFPREDRD